MSKSVTEHQNSNVFICERCNHRFAGYVANGNKRFCSECRKEQFNETQNLRRNGHSVDVHVSHATYIIDGFLNDSCADKKFIKISEILFWVKEHPDTVPPFWSSDIITKRWITKTLKTKYPYRNFSTDVYIRVD